MGKKYERQSEIISELYEAIPEQYSEKEIKKLRDINNEFLAGFNMLVDKRELVTVFGSSRVEEGTPLYKSGIELGRVLAESGFSVLTGGGPGCMEAVNRGASEAGGKSMGINIEIPAEQEGNRYAVPSITANHFFVRKVLLLKYSIAYIFLPGGYGTLDELFETLTLMQSKKIKPFPLILIGGDFWSGILKWLDKTVSANKMIGQDDKNYFMVADSPSQALKIIEKKRL